MENAFDDMDEVLKACEGISVDISDVKEEDIDFYDNVITLPLPTSAIDKNSKPVTLPCTLSVIDDQIILFTNK